MEYIIDMLMFVFDWDTLYSILAVVMLLHNVVHPGSEGTEQKMKVRGEKYNINK